MSVSEPESGTTGRPEVEAAPWGDQVRLSEEGNTEGWLLVDEGSLVGLDEWR